MWTSASRFWIGREDEGSFYDVEHSRAYRDRLVLKFVSIEHESSELRHCRRVDMVTPKFLNPRIRDQVLNSAEALYVAA